MSTKIYEGLKIELGPEQSLFQLANKMRTILEEGVHKQVRENLADEIRGAIVKAITPPVPEKEKEQQSYLDVLTEVFMKPSDEEPTASLMFVEPEGRNYLLAAPLGRITGDMHKQLLALEGVSDYGYWNNTDRPEDVTDQEWDTRRQDWDAIGYGPAIDYGLSIQLSDHAKSRYAALDLSDDEAWEAVAAEAYGPATHERLTRTILRSHLWQHICLQADKEEWSQASYFTGWLIETDTIAGQMLEEDPTLVVLPDLDPKHLRTEEPLGLAEVNLSDGEGVAIAQRILAD